MPEKWEENPLQIGRRSVGLGDETFTIGLFRKHFGTKRNVPMERSSVAGRTDCNQMGADEGIPCRNEVDC
jgi:hypothetical protein